MKVLFQKSWFNRSIIDCSFEKGHEGAYYAGYIDKMRLRGQIGNFGWDPSKKVSTSWDIGVDDHTAIIWFQTDGRNVYIIDCYEKSGEGIPHYADIINSKPYSYDYHWAPHDIAVREWGSGLSRLEQARQLDLVFETKDNGASSKLPALSFIDGINSARAMFAILWIDERNCSKLIRCLENYRKAYDANGNETGKAVHDANSHYADSFRYMSISLSLTRRGQSTPEELERRYIEACNNGKKGHSIATVFNNQPLGPGNPFRM